VLPRRVAWQIILGAYDILKEEETLVNVEIPAGETIDVIGDTHGQYYDFMNLLSLTGKPSPTHTLLFNGDFVDRGSWSTEIMLVLFAYKWLHPTKIFLNRGNHETCEFSDLSFQIYLRKLTMAPLSRIRSGYEQSVRIRGRDEEEIL